LGLFLAEKCTGTHLALAPLLYASWVALALIAGCSAKEENPAPPPLGVTIAAVVQKDVPIRQEWVGTMVGNVDAQIRPKVEGFLLTRLYTEGSYVEKGQPMFQLDKRQTQAAVEQATGNLERARAVLSQAQIDVRRFTPLVAQKAVSQAELDKATSSERAASATVDADQAALDNAKLNQEEQTSNGQKRGVTERRTPEEEKIRKRAEAASG
jgi:membrane fusion protein (multidrug efflux system)